MLAKSVAKRVLVVAAIAGVGAKVYLKKNASDKADTLTAVAEGPIVTSV